MAANLAAMRAAFTRLAFSQQAAVALVDEQGLDDLGEVARLDDASVVNLCNTVRRPGGVIIGPDNVPLPNPGIPISARAERNLSSLAFWARHRVRISRPATPADVTVEAVDSLVELRTREKTFVRPTEKPKINHKDWFHTMELIQEYCAQSPGVTKIPLAYVLREDVEVPNHEADPSTNYSFHQLEMIRRAPHGTATYKEDCEAVFGVIQQMCENDASYIHIKPAFRERDGRMAYMLLNDHYLGKGASNQIITLATRKLESLTYNGKDSRRFTFETYVAQHKTQHAILDTFHERGLHPGIDEPSKVRYFLNGLSDQRLEAPKSGILASPELFGSFNKASEHCASFLALKAATAPTNRVQISSVETVNDDKDKVEIRYYSKDEYKQLSDKQKLKLKELRAKKKGTKQQQPPKAHKANSKTLQKKFKRLTKQISAIKAQIKPVAESDESESDEEDEIRPLKPPGPGAGGGNRSNPALQRGKTRK